MKKTVKKILSLIMALAIALSTSIASFASTATESDAVKEDDPNEIVATLSLCSCIYLFPISGHTWIYVHNNSDEPITVGLYEVPVGQGVSMGCFAFTAYDGWGIYYNLEAYRENKNDNMDTHWSISKGLTRSDLNKLTKTLINFPNTWNPIINCATFAFVVWNAVAGGFFISLLIPAISQFEVIIGGGKKGVLEMYYPEKNQVYRQRGFGSNAYLEPVGQYTIGR